MKINRILAIIFLILIGVVLSYTITKDPHSFSEGECSNCHYDSGGNSGKLKAPVSTLCRGCHSMVMKGSTHPVDIVPRIAKVPPDLPLTDGTITCNTCHDVHTSSTIIFGIESHFLRRQVSDVKDFCVACHEDDFQRPGHKELFIVAHEANKYVITNPDENIDPLSSECIGCHDGNIGPAVDFSVGSGVWMHTGSGHPIGVDYREARRKGNSLRPVEELNKKIRLFNGKVGCATCHDWFIEKNVKLVMDMDKSILCMECHYQK